MQELCADYEIAFGGSKLRLQQLQGLLAMHNIHDGVELAATSRSKLQEVTTGRPADDIEFICQLAEVSGLPWNGSW